MGWVSISHRPRGERRRGRAERSIGRRARPSAGSPNRPLPSACGESDDDDADNADHADHAARSLPGARSSSLNKADFLWLLGGAWPAFNKLMTIIGAFRRVGITQKKTSVELMQQDKFKAADMLLNRATATSAAAAAASAATAAGELVRELSPGQQFAPMALRNSLSTPAAAASSAPPEHIPAQTVARIGSTEYWWHLHAEERRVSASLRAQLAWYLSTPRLPTLADEEVFAFDEVQNRAPGGKKRVGVGIFGCMEEAGALEAVAAAKAAEVEKEAAKVQRALDKEAKKGAAEAAKGAVAAKRGERVADYFACLDARNEQRAPCACGAADANSCKLKKHKLCPTCESVTLNGCTKKGGPC